MECLFFWIVNFTVLYPTICGGNYVISIWIKILGWFSQNNQLLLSSHIRHAHLDKYRDFQSLMSGFKEEPVYEATPLECVSVSELAACWWDISVQQSTFIRTENSVCIVLVLCVQAYRAQRGGTRELINVQWMIKGMKTNSDVKVLNFINIAVNFHCLQTLLVLIEKKAYIPYF